MSKISKKYRNRTRKYSGKRNSRKKSLRRKYRRKSIRRKSIRRKSIRRKSIRRKSLRKKGGMEAADAWSSEAVAQADKDFRAQQESIERERREAAAAEAAAAEAAKQVREAAAEKQSAPQTEVDVPAVVVQREQQLGTLKEQLTEVNREIEIAEKKLEEGKKSLEAWLEENKEERQSLTDNLDRARHAAAANPEAAAEEKKAMTALRDFQQQENVQRSHFSNLVKPYNDAVEYKELLEHAIQLRTDFPSKYKYTPDDLKYTMGLGLKDLIWKNRGQVMAIAEVEDIKSLKKEFSDTKLKKILLEVVEEDLESNPMLGKRTTRTSNRERIFTTSTKQLIPAEVSFFGEENDMVATHRPAEGTTFAGTYPMGDSKIDFKCTLSEPYQSEEEDWFLPCSPNIELRNMKSDFITHLCEDINRQAEIFVQGGDRDIYEDITSSSSSLSTAVDYVKGGVDWAYNRLVGKQEPEPMQEPMQIPMETLMRYSVAADDTRPTQPSSPPRKGATTKKVSDFHASQAALGLSELSARANRVKNELYKIVLAQVKINKQMKELSAAHEKLPLKKMAELNQRMFRVLYNILNPVVFNVKTSRFGEEVAQAWKEAGAKQTMANLRAGFGEDFFCTSHLRKNEIDKISVEVGTGLIIVKLNERSLVAVNELSEWWMRDMFPDPKSREYLGVTDALKMYFDVQPPRDVTRDGKQLPTDPDKIIETLTRKLVSEGVLFEGEELQWQHGKEICEQLQDDYGQSPLDMKVNKHAAIRFFAYQNPYKYVKKIEIKFKGTHIHAVGLDGSRGTQAVIKAAPIESLVASIKTNCNISVDFEETKQQCIKDFVESTDYVGSADTDDILSEYMEQFDGISVDHLSHSEISAQASRLIEGGARPDSEPEPEPEPKKLEATGGGAAPDAATTPADAATTLATTPVVEGKPPQPAAVRAEERGGAAPDAARTPAVAPAAAASLAVIPEEGVPPG